MVANFDQSLWLADGNVSRARCSQDKAGGTRQSLQVLRPENQYRQCHGQSADQTWCVPLAAAAQISSTLHPLSFDGFMFDHTGPLHMLQHLVSIFCRATLPTGSMLNPCT